jgi:hypothetical protein
VMYDGLPAAPPGYGHSDSTGSYQHTHTGVQQLPHPDLQACPPSYDSRLQQPELARAFQPTMMAAGMNEDNGASTGSTQEQNLQRYMQTQGWVHNDQSEWQRHPAGCNCQACAEAWSRGAGG